MTKLIENDCLRKYKSTLNVARIYNISTDKPMAEIEQEIIRLAKETSPPPRTKNIKIMYPTDIDELQAAKISLIVRHVISSDST